VRREHTEGVGGSRVHVVLVFLLLRDCVDPINKMQREGIDVVVKTRQGNAFVCGTR